jgi:hypothetical protein
MQHKYKLIFVLRTSSRDLALVLHSRQVSREQSQLFASMALLFSLVVAVTMYSGFLRATTQ